VSAAEIYIEESHFFGSISSSMMIVPFDSVKICVVGGVEIQTCIHLLLHIPESIVNQFYAPCYIDTFCLLSKDTIISRSEMYPRRAQNLSHLHGYCPTSRNHCAFL
jgi:hypothetical protein